MLAINIALTVMGIAFFAVSLYLLWKAGGNVENSYAGLLSGAISIAAFVTLFFIKPQQYITKALGNVAQIEFIYKAQLLTYTATFDVYNSKIKKIEEIKIEDLIKLNKELERTTKFYLFMIEKNIEFEVETPKNNNPDAKDPNQ